MAIGGAGVEGVLLGVDHPIARHGKGTSAEHGYVDPSEGVPARPALGRQHHARVGEWQGEQRLPNTNRAGVSGNLSANYKAGLDDNSAGQRGLVGGGIHSFASMLGPGIVGWNAASMVTVRG